MNYSKILKEMNNKLNILAGGGYTITIDDEGRFYLNGRKMKIKPMTEDVLNGTRYMGLSPEKEYLALVPLEAQLMI
jgi:hypothetical protein